MTKKVIVRVPATSANLGPGFDCLGAALGLYNEITVSRLHKNSRSKIIIKGLGKGEINENSKNLVYRVIRDLFNKAGLKCPPLEIKCVNNIPLARGLGSSAAAIAGALIAGNKLLGNRFRLENLIKIACEIEGHADNVVPAFLGGLVITRAQGRGVLWWQEKVADDICAVVCIPDFEVITKNARKLVPLKYSRKTSIFTTSGAAFFVSAVASKPSKQRDEIIKEAMEDKFHQPHRRKLIKGMDKVFQSAKKAGALGAALSGSGPSIIALVKKNGRLNAVGDAMVRAFRRFKINSEYKILNFVNHGVKIK